MKFQKIRDNQASRYIELPPKYKISKSILNIQNEDNFCFLWCIFASLYPAGDNKYRTSNYAVFWNTLNIQVLEFPMRVKVIPNLERLNNLNTNVFELDKLLSPVYINSNYAEPQIAILLYESRYCPITKLHCLIIKRMKHI